jgi:hypothetical protein
MRHAAKEKSKTFGYGELQSRAALYSVLIDSGVRGLQCSGIRAVILIVTVTVTRANIREYPETSNSQTLLKQALSATAGNSHELMRAHS